MTTGTESRVTVSPIENGVRHLVRIAGGIAGLPEGQVRSLMSDALDEADPVAIEEIILQSYLFAGFPRTLNAMRTWRSVSERPAPVAVFPTAAGSEAVDAADGFADDPDLWRRRGEETCAVVYGDSYEKLRDNIRHLHPALDDWMIVDGYGKVLSRPAVDLKTRELCVVAALRGLGPAAAIALPSPRGAQCWRVRSGDRGCSRCARGLDSPRRSWPL